MLVDGPPLAPIWCVRANIVDCRPFGPLGLERKVGTKHFRPGAKLWVIDAFYGMADTVIVVGQHRSSLRFVKMALDARLLRNIRAAMLYKPRVLRIVAEHFYGAPEALDEEAAKSRARVFTSWQQFRARPPGTRLYTVVASGHDTTRLIPLDGATGLQADVPNRLLSAELRVVGAKLAVTLGEDGDVQVGLAEAQL